jgi:adenylate kinase family enzyme
MSAGSARGALPPIGRRICVVGTSASGKTYVARELARRLGLAYINNDEIIWRPNWQPTPREQRRELFDIATQVQEWAVDGNLGSSPEDQLLLNRCDTIVWLDLPRWQVWSQVVTRTLGRLLTREELWHGNRESLRMLFSRDSIVWWSVKSYASIRGRYTALFASDEFSGRTRIRLTSRGEVNRWIRMLPTA